MQLNQVLGIVLLKLNGLSRQQFLSGVCFLIGVTREGY